MFLLIFLYGSMYSPLILIQKFIYSCNRSKMIAQHVEEWAKRVLWHLQKAFLVIFSWVTLRLNHTCGITKERERNVMKVNLTKLKIGLIRYVLETAHRVNQIIQNGAGWVESFINYCVMGLWTLDLENPELQWWKVENFYFELF